MADLVYNDAKRALHTGEIDWLNDTIKVMLVTSSYTANADHIFVDEGGANDPIDHELTGTGYAAGHGNAGRITLAGATIVTDLTNDRAEFDSTTNPTWSSINAGTAAAAIVHRQGVSGDTTANMITYIDSGGFPIVTNGGDLTITWNAEGIFYLA